MKMRLPLSMASLITALLLGVGVLVNPAGAASGILSEVHLEAVIIDGAPPLQNDVSFIVQRLNADGTRQVVAQQFGGSAKISLPRGRYKATARYGVAVSIARFSVDDRPLKMVLAMNAGRVHLQAIPKVGAATMNRPLRWDLFTFGRGSDGKRIKVVSLEEARPSLVLPQGFYIAHVWSGDLTARHTIEVAAGRTYTYTMTLDNKLAQTASGE